MSFPTSSIYILYIKSFFICLPENWHGYPKWRHICCRRYILSKTAHACLFFSKFSGVSYIYILQLLLPDVSPFNCLLLKLQSQPPRDPYIRLPTSARRPSRAERFTLAASSLGTIKRWKPANGWVLAFSLYPNWKKNALQIEAYVFLFVSLSQGSGFLWVFFVFWRIPLKAPVPFEAYEAFFFKKGSFHRGQIFHKIWVIVLGVNTGTPWGDV